MLKHTLALIIVCIGLEVSCLAGDPIDRIEPPFWWSGMQNQDLQLMIYGENLCQLDVSISSSSVELERVHKADNCNYLFLDLRIVSDKQSFEFPIDFKNDNQSFTSTYSIKEKNKPIITDGFDQSDAIYLITPDRFANGDPSNDDIDGYKELANRKEDYGRHGGDLKGINDQLGYIRDIGFSAIWLNPILENDMPKYSYHGYACTDYYQVDKRFGSNDYYQTFVANAQRAGLKVIMDMIVNHCGLHHWWMEDQPFDDWINKWDQYTETSHKKLTLQDPNASKYDRKVYNDGWFVTTMPDMNQRNPFLAKYLIQNSIWWTQFLGLNGIRMDTYSYANNQFMVDWVDALASEFPDLSIVGEEWNENASVVAYWQADKWSVDSLESELEFLMDFPLNQTVPKAFSEEEGWGTGLVKIYNSVAMDFLYPSPHNLLIFPDNHDMSRIYTLLDEDLRKLKMVTTLYLTMRGIPQFYYGTEILKTSPKERNDGKIRSDYPGGWEGDEINAFEGIGLTADQKDYKNFLTEMLEWRSEEAVIHHGKLTHFVPFDGMYVYFRHNAKDAFMVIHNKNEKTSTLKLDRFEEILKDYNSGVNILDAEEVFDLGSSLEVEGMSATVLELR